jgi:hypothetical protein
MKDQSTDAMNSISHAGSVYANFTLHHMQKLTDLIVKENARMLEQTQEEFQAVSHAKTPAEVFQVVSEQMMRSVSESLAFSWKLFTLGHQEQTNLLAAVQKQLAESSAEWQGLIDKVPSGSFASPGLVLNAVKSALEMGQHALEVSQTTSQKTAALLTESLNGSGRIYQSNSEVKSGRRSAQA